MRISRLLASVAVMAAFSATLFAQQAPAGFHSVACIKVKSDKGSEYRKWAAEDLHKYAQSRVDAGVVSTWYLLRSVIPTGTSAECDYLIVIMYPAAPPKPMGVEDLAAALKKAGMSMSAQEYIDKRNSLTTLVSQNLFQNQAFVGSAQKGDYFLVNYMKVHGNISDWIAYEKKVWKPFAEAIAKDGLERGWSLNVQYFPRGTDLAFDAVTVDVYPSWDAIYKDDPQFPDRFRKVHPDMELGTTFEEFEKLRTILSTKVYVLDDLIAAK